MSRISQMRVRLGTAALAGAMLAGLPMAGAYADVITYSLESFNVSGYPAPFGTATVDLTSSTAATITFQSGSSGGFNYYFIGQGAAAVNVNATSWTISSETAVAAPGFTTATLSNGGSGNEDGWGVFNQTVNAFDGFDHASQTISFDLADTSGTWADAASVLIDNSDGHLVAAHIAVCTVGNCSSSNGSLATGYATNGAATVPEPTSAALVGTGLFALGWILRRRRV